MYGDDGVERVALLRKHGARVELLGKLLHLCDGPREVGFNIFAFTRKLKVRLGFVGPA